MSNENKPLIKSVSVFVLVLGIIIFAVIASLGGTRLYKAKGELADKEVMLNQKISANTDVLAQKKDERSKMFEKNGITESYNELSSEINSLQAEIDADSSALKEITSGRAFKAQIKNNIPFFGVALAALIASVLLFVSFRIIAKKQSRLQ